MTALSARRLSGLAPLIIGLTILGVMIVGALGAGAAVADRTVSEVEGITSCAELATELDSATVWRGVRLGSPRDGDHSDGIVSVEVTSYSGSSFDWSSDVSLDAVLLGYESASGQEIGQIAFAYEPEAFSDSEVGLDELHPGAEITEITFCHDPGSDETTTTTTVATTTSDTEPPTTVPDSADELAETGSEDLVLAAIGITLVALGIGTIVSAGTAYKRAY